MFLSNAKYPHAINPDGIARNILGMNSSGNVLIGYGPWNNDDASATVLYGSDYINVYSKGGNAINTLHGGFAIPADSDLNDYLTVGNYYSGNATNSATIVNTPYTGGSFSLKVMCPYGTVISGNATVIQEVTTTQGARYMRRSGDSGATWTVWRRIYSEATLYNNTSGSNGTITLSESAANFTYLEIFVTDNNGADRASFRVYSPNGKKVGVSLVESAAANSTLIRRSRYAISGTSITPSNGSYVQFSNTDVVLGSATNYIKVLRVVGYR